MAFWRTRYLIFGRRSLWLLLVAVLAAAGVLTGIIAQLPAWSVPAVATERKIPIYCTDRPGKVVSLTFDAAWGNEDTQTLIDILQERGLTATFFVVGDWVDRYPDSVRALAAAGNEVMNHSLDHAHFSSLREDEIITNVTAAQIPISLTSFILIPATISMIRDIMESPTTNAVTTICIVSLNPPISLPASSRANILYPIVDIQLLMTNIYIPTLKSLDEIFFSDT